MARTGRDTWKNANSVFVGNIPHTATEEQLEDVFRTAGPVVSFRYAVCGNFSCVLDCARRGHWCKQPLPRLGSDRAPAAFKPVQLQRLESGPTHSIQTCPRPWISRRIAFHSRGVSKFCSLTEPFGRLVKNPDNGQPKGFGFCEFRDPQTAESAIRNLHNYEFGGRPLRVDYAANQTVR